MDGVRSWALWWVRPHPEAAMASGSLKAADGQSCPSEQRHSSAQSVAWPEISKHW